MKRVWLISGIILLVWVSAAGVILIQSTVQRLRINRLMGIDL